MALRAPSSCARCVNCSRTRCWRCYKENLLSEEQEQHFNILFLGGGSGVYVGAIRAAQLGMNVAVVERDKLGGTCLHRGCIPSKAYLEAAQVYSELQHAGAFAL